MAYFPAANIDVFNFYFAEERNGSNAGQLKMLLLAVNLSLQSGKRAYKVKNKFIGGYSNGGDQKI
jgi:hypothetical protein